MVDLLCTTPAKLFGMYPRKGTIAPGSDADIVVFDPNRNKVITATGQHSKSDYNLYEGTEVTGDVDTVLVRGTVVVESGELTSGAGLRAVREAREVRGSAGLATPTRRRGQRPPPAPFRRSARERAQHRRQPALKGCISGFIPENTPPDSGTTPRRAS